MLFVDVGAVLINGQNVGLFNNDPNQPLSIISENLELGNYQDNTNNVIPIEYDGVSSVLSIVAPVQQGENTIKFAIADTGDTIFDSGLFVSNFATSGVDTGDGGSGVLLNAPGTEEADEIVGDETDQFIEGLGGNDTINPGGGNDIIDAGAGDDLILGGIGNNGIDGGEGNDTVAYTGNQADLTTALADGSITVTGNSDSVEFTDTLTNVETIQYGDGSLSTDTLQPAPPETDGIVQGQNLVVDSTGVIGSVDLVTGEFVEILDTDISLTDIDVDPNGNVFGISSSELYSIDLETELVTSLGSHGVAGLLALEIGEDGTFYATSGSRQDVYTLDPSDGAATSIGTFPFSVQSAGDLQFINNTLYLSDRNELISLDVEGGTLNDTTLVGSFGLDSGSILGITVDEDGDPVGLTDTGDILALDISTGEATQIGTIEDNTAIFGAAAIPDGFFGVEDEDITGVDVYRFSRTDTQTQFYTTTDVERESVLANLPQYELEGISFVGVAVPEEGGRFPNRD